MFAQLFTNSRAFGSFDFALSVITFALHPKLSRCSGAEECTGAHHIVLELQARKRRLRVVQSCFQITPACCQDQYHEQKQYLSSSTSVRALWCFLPIQEGRNCQAVNKNRWALHCVSSPSKAQSYCGFIEGNVNWPSADSKAEQNQQCFYENLVVRHCVHCGQIWAKSF